MIKLIFRLFLLSIFFLTSTSLFADSTNTAAFNAAYKKYQQYAGIGNFYKALPYAEEAYELGVNLFGEDNKNTAALSYNYGRMLVETGRGEQAKPILKKTLNLYKTIYGENALELVDPLMSLGHASAKYSNSRYQKKYYKSALAIVEKHKGTKSELYADLSLEAGREVLHRAQTRDGLRYIKRAYKFFKANLGADHAKTGVAAFHLGQYELARKRYRSAEEYFLESLNTFEHPDEPSNPAELSTHAFLIEVYEELEESEKSTEHCLAIGRMTPYEPDQDYKPLYKRRPTYPRRALRNGREGYAIVEFTVGIQGFVTDAKAIETFGHDSFADAAIEAAKKFRYAPQFVDGEPVPTEGVQNKITFEIVN